MEILQILGERIRHYIRESNFENVEHFAKENSIPKSTLSELLNGKNDPKFSTLKKIATGLGISLHELLSDPRIDKGVRAMAPKRTTKSTGEKKATKRTRSR